MKAYELHPEEGFDALQAVDRPYPTALGPHEVCIRVRAVSLNYRDLVMARGAKRSKRPIVPASDGAGQVIAVGDEVTRGQDRRAGRGGVLPDLGQRGVP